MEGMENKLSAVLNDPASMEKVMAIAKSLSSGDGAPKPEHHEHDHHDEEHHERGDKKSMLPALLETVAPTGDAGNLIRMISGMDPKILNGVSRVIGEYSRPDDERVRLLHSLKPYMRESRRCKMDQAVNIVKLAHTARIALEAFGGGKHV